MFCIKNLIQLYSNKGACGNARTSIGFTLDAKAFFGTSKHSVHILTLAA